MMQEVLELRCSEINYNDGDNIESKVIRLLPEDQEYEYEQNDDSLRCAEMNLIKEDESYYQENYERIKRGK